MKRSRVPRLAAQPRAFPLYMQLVEDVRYTEVPRHLDWNTLLAWRCTHRAAARAWPRHVRDVPLVCNEAVLDMLITTGAARTVEALCLSALVDRPLLAQQFPALRTLGTHEFLDVWPPHLTDLRMCVRHVLDHTRPLPPVEILTLVNFDYHFYESDVKRRELVLPRTLRILTCAAGETSASNAIVPVAMRFEAPERLERLEINETWPLIELDPVELARMTSLTHLVINGAYSMDAALPRSLVSLAMHYCIFLTPAQLAPLTCLRSLVLSGETLNSETDADMRGFLASNEMPATLVDVAWASDTGAARMCQDLPRDHRRWRRVLDPENPLPGIDCYYRRK